MSNNHDLIYSYLRKQAAGNSMPASYPPPYPPNGGYGPSNNYQFMQQKQQDQEDGDNRWGVTKAVHNISGAIANNPIAHGISAFGLADMTARHMLVKDMKKPGQWRLGVPSLAVGAVTGIPLGTDMAGMIGGMRWDPEKGQKTTQKLMHYTSKSLGENISNKINQLGQKISPHISEGGKFHKAFKGINTASRWAGHLGMAHMGLMVANMLTGPRNSPPPPPKQPEFEFQDPKYKVASLRNNI